MSLFPSTIKAALGGQNVRMSYLALFDFVDEPMRVWTGFGRITTGGEVWAGIGDVASVSGIEQAINGSAPQATLVVTASNPDIVRLTRDEFREKARDRFVYLYIQFHNAADDQPLTLYDEPYAVWAGQMQAAIFELQNDGTREITVQCESRFALRSRPSFSQYTDRDQDRRFSGDRGFEFVPSLRNKVVTWPDF